MQDWDEAVSGQITAATKRVLDVAGLFPVFTSSARRSRRGSKITLSARGTQVTLAAKRLTSLMRRTTRERTAASEWPEELLSLWKAGIVWLRDAESDVADTVRVNAAQAVVRRSMLQEYCVLDGRNVLIDESAIGHHSSIVGPVALMGTEVESHCRIAGNVIADRARARSFVRLVGGVKIHSYTGIGSHSAIFGRGYHREKMALRPDNFERHGVELGADNWIGPGVSMLGGTRTGRGVVVAGGTHLHGHKFEHAFVVGAPPKALPIDLNVRGSSHEEARAVGRVQGWAAALLPSYGPCDVGVAEPGHIEIDYPEHWCARHPEHTQLASFHAGALEAFISLFVPGSAPHVAARVGKTVRFDVWLQRNLPPHVVLRVDTAVRLMPGATPTPGDMGENMPFDLLVD